MLRSGRICGQAVPTHRVVKVSGGQWDLVLMVDVLAPEMLVAAGPMGLTDCTTHEPNHDLMIPGTRWFSFLYGVAGGIVTAT